MSWFQKFVPAKIRTEVHNQHGEQVMWMESFGMFACRPRA